MLQQDTISSGQVEYFEYNGKTEKPQLTFEVPALVNDNYSPDSMTIGTKQSGVYMPTVVYIWVFGVILMLGYAVASYVRLRKEVKASIKKNGNIYVCDEINSPFILGIIRPRIYLPSGMSEEVSENVVAHEKAQDVALKMHMNGMTNSFIAEIVGYAENVVAGWIAAAQS